MDKDNNVNAANVTIAGSDANAANAGNFISSDTATVNGAIESAAGAKIDPSSGAFFNQANSANSSATLTVMSPGSSSSSSSSSPVTLNSEGAGSYTISGNISSTETDGHLTIAANSTINGTVQMPHITIKPGVTATFNQGITAPCKIDTGEDSITAKLLANIAGPCTITGNDDGTIGISPLSGENPFPEIEHDA